MCLHQEDMAYGVRKCSRDEPEDYAFDQKARQKWKRRGKVSLEHTCSFFSILPSFIFEDWHFENCFWIWTSHELTQFLFKSLVGLGMVAHCCDPSIYKAKVGKLPHVCGLLGYRMKACLRKTKPRINK